MAKLVIGGRSFEIAPYKLGAIRKAAPHIDAINASVQALEVDAEGSVMPVGGIVGLLENTEHIVAILAIGLQKIDPALTADALDDMIGPDDMAALGIALRDILAESGLAPKGEAMAPAEPTETAGASTSS
jgi:hypothetical protein